MPDQHASIEGSPATHADAGSDAEETLYSAYARERRQTSSVARLRTRVYDPASADFKERVRAAIETQTALMDITYEDLASAAGVSFASLKAFMAERRLLSIDQVCKLLGELGLGVEISFAPQGVSKL